MDKPKGGRGHAAPYSTKQMRVPEALEDQVQELIARYREWITESGCGSLGSSNPPRLLDQPVYDLFTLIQEQEKTDLEERCQELEQKIKDVDKFIHSMRAVADCLQQALKLKANTGGAIKIKVKEAMEILNSFPTDL